MWKTVLKYDRTYIPYRKTLIILSKHFLENLENRFPDITLRRVENAIKRKISKNEIPMNKRIFIKLMRQKHEGGKKPQKIRPAFLVVEREKYEGRGLKTKITAITIREMHINSQENKTILEEN